MRWPGFRTRNEIPSSAIFKCSDSLVAGRVDWVKGLYHGLLRVGLPMAIVDSIRQTFRRRIGVASKRILPQVQNCCRRFAV